MKSKLWIVLVLFLLSISQIIGQQIYLDQLEDIDKEFRKTGSFNVKDSSAIFSKLNNIKQKAGIGFSDCKLQYSYYRLASKFYYDIYEDQKYIDLYRDSILPAVIECHGEIHPLASLSYFQIGTTLEYNEWAEPEEIEDYFFKSLKIENQLGEPSQYSALIYSTIGEFYNYQGDSAKSLFYNDMALKSLKDYRRSGNITQIYHNIARAHQAIGDNDAALENFLLAIEAARIAHPNNDQKIVSHNYEEAGEIFLNLERFKEAESYTLKSMELSRTHFPNELEMLSRQKLKLANIYTTKGEFAKAEKLLNEVKENYLNNISEYSLDRAYWINKNIAINNFAAGDIATALDYYHQSIQAHIVGLSGEVLQNPTIKSSSIYSSNRIADAFKGKLECLYTLGKDQKNIDYLLSAIDVTKKLDTLIKYDLINDWQEGSQQFLIKEHRGSYQNGINAAIVLEELTDDSKYYEEAYDISSRIKSQLLYRGLTIKKKNEDEVNEDLQAIQDSLEKDVLEKETAYTTALMKKSEEEKKTLIQNLFNAKESLDIFKRDNGLAKLLNKEDVVFVPKLKQVQKSLTADQAILEYHINENELISFLITSDKIFLQKSEIVSEEIIQFYEGITIGEKIEDQKMSQQLLSVLAMSKFNGKQLIIIPDQELLQIPFEILSFNDKHLLNTFNVSYEYSSGFVIDNSYKDYPKNYVGFASDYEDDGFDELKNNFTTNPEGISISPLKYSVEEVESAAKIFQGEANINDEASKRNFENNSNGAQVLHLALHGVLSESSPDQSALIFSSDKGDHLLTAAEIYQLDINAGLTVLSACNTGVGPVRVGDGVRSLARSFIHAGSESVITSLWEISDLTTKKILENFYSYLNDGLTKSQALRQAKLDFIENASPSQRHPKYWAHLVLVGDAGVIQSATGGKLKYIILAAACLFFLLMLRYVGSKMKSLPL